MQQHTSHNVWKKLSSKKTEPKKNWDVFSWKNWAFWRYFWKILRKKATKLNKSSQKCNLQLSLWRSLLIFQENVKIIGKSSIFPPKLSILGKTEANFAKKTQCVGGIVHIVPPVQVFKKYPWINYEELYQIFTEFTSINYMKYWYFSI